ncbi:MAG: PaaI family thioesterase [Minisyncoccota bacterium]
MADETQAATPESLREMIDQDSFAGCLGAVMEEVRPGYARARMSLDARHRNFMQMVHGGAIFGLADVAFGACANSFGTKAVAVHVGIDYLDAPGDTPFLVAEVEQVGRAGRVGHYSMRVATGEGRVIATCSGWAYHTGRPLD